jgi:hypothetical protein
MKLRYNLIVPQEIKKHEDYKNKIGYFGRSEKFYKFVFHLNTIIMLLIINKVKLKIKQGISSLSLSILSVSIRSTQKNKTML